MGKKSIPTEGEEAVPENLRCSRTDGRQWRCRRRVMKNLKLCEIHYLQGRHRQHKEKVPESLKLQRKRQNDAVKVQIGAKKKKKRKSAEELENRRKQLELIRMVLQREVEKKKNKKQNESQLNLNLNLNLHLHYDHEMRKELPNGVMAIASASNVTPRYFRSKNVERGSVTTLQVVQGGWNLKKGRRKKCHWCQRSDSWSLIRCSSCQREFFCMDCIKQRLEFVTCFVHLWMQL